MQVRDRVKELRRVPATELQPNPRNWRTHPENQKDTLRGLLAEVGYADALLARELPDGSLQLIDGHLRAETTPDQQVPVLILDVNAAESDLILATLDPLAAMAERNKEQLGALLGGVETENDAVRRLLLDLAQTEAPTPDSSSSSPPECAIPVAYQVVVQCADESVQQSLYERLTAEGYDCRVLTLA